MKFLILLVFLIFVSGCVQQTEQRPENTTQVNQEAGASQLDFEFNFLKSQLENAQLKVISPETYEESDKKIKELEAQGYDKNKIQELRDLLSQFIIGGTETSQQNNKTSSQNNQTFVETRPFWEYKNGKWVWSREGVPPECPNPLVLEAPVDLGLVKAILYPGQVRGGDFKPHGGFVLQDGTKAVTLRAPIDGYLTSVAKFTDDFGLHYGLTFIHSCGIIFGGGHYGALPPDIQEVVDKIPLKGYGESTTEQVIPPYFVKKGQIIVTGLQENVKPTNAGFDWGVADLRKENDASKNLEFRVKYGEDPWNNFYGVCWLDLLPEEQEEIVRSFPGGDWKEGKNSEYC